MKTRRVHVLVAYCIPLLLQAACGGDPSVATEPAETAKTAEVGASEAGGGPGGLSTTLGPGGAALASPLSSAPSEGPPRLNPNGIPASRIEASLARYESAFQDETSCWTKEDPCDGDYAIELNRKSSGMVGWWNKKNGRDVFVDAQDLLRLPSVSGAVTVFVKNNTASKDWLDVTLEDRTGTRLYGFPPLAVGASAAISWTRTDDRAAGPYRLRLSARTGSGDHTVSYTVLPIAHSQWLAQVQARP